MLVDFFDPGDAAEVTHTEDFLMQLSDTVTLLDARGRETVVKVDVPARIRENIENYWRAEAERRKAGRIVRSRANPERVRRDTADPKGVLARDDVRALTAERQ